MLRPLDHETCGHAEDSREVVLVRLEHSDEALHGSVDVGFDLRGEEGVVLENLRPSLVPTTTRGEGSERRDRGESRRHTWRWA
jgi:hypothetical protein